VLAQSQPHRARTASPDLNPTTKMRNLAVLARSPSLDVEANERRNVASIAMAISTVNVLSVQPAAQV